ncbi:MAG: helix-turn-helix domain-containing protein, partial [Solirubrobacterales bacterium]
MASSTRAPDAEALVGYGAGERPGARLPTPPTQARGVEKRDRIYDAAVTLYEENGIDAARVEDVIAEAGVSWATFFRYFPRKEDVLIEHAARHFRDRVRAA